MLQAIVAVVESSTVAPATYARHDAGWLVEPSVRGPEAFRLPATKRSRVAVGSIWNESDALACTSPST
jgi:hypothetical protein